MFTLLENGHLAHKEQPILARKSEGAAQIWQIDFLPMKPVYIRRANPYLLALFNMYVTRTETGYLQLETLEQVNRAMAAALLCFEVVGPNDAEMFYESFTDALDMVRAGWQSPKVWSFSAGLFNSILALNPEIIQ